MIFGNSNLAYLVVLSPWVLGAVFELASAQGYAETAARQQVTMGIVVSHEVYDHNRYGYRFQVGGRDYAGSETPLRTEPKVGQAVKVYYDPADPARNGLTDFRERTNRGRGLGVALLVLATFCGAIILAIGKARSGV